MLLEFAACRARNGRWHIHVNDGNWILRFTHIVGTTVKAIRRAGALGESAWLLVFNGRTRGCVVDSIQAGRNARTSSSLTRTIG